MVELYNVVHTRLRTKAMSLSLLYTTPSGYTRLDDLDLSEARSLVV